MAPEHRRPHSRQSVFDRLTEAERARLRLQSSATKPTKRGSRLLWWLLAIVAGALVIWAALNSGF